MIELRRPTSGDLPAMQRALSLAFASEEEAIGSWIEAAGLDLFRLLEVDGDLAGTALLAPMGQYFGGVSVPMTGVAAVTILPEMRGRGLARELMHRCLEEIRESGSPLSVLFASTQSLYRTVGYEQAGHFCSIRLPLNAIDAARPGDVRPVTDDDRDAIADCYRRSVAHQDGHLDRGPYLWNRVYSPRRKAARGFAVENAGVIDAYVFFTQKDELPEGRYTLYVTDIQAATPAAARAILSFLTGFRSMAHEAVFHAGPVAPLLALLPEQHYTITRREYWMLRLADVTGALRVRAYARAIGAEVHLDIVDDVMPDNAGRYVVSVENGRAHVEPGGEGHIRLDARALAAVYTGFLDPRSLSMLGLIEGPGADLESLASIFSGPTPAMADIF